MARIQRQQGVALPDELRAELERAASAGGVSVSEEIRRRLTESFAAEQEAVSPLLRLQNDVAKFAGFLQKHMGENWSTHPGGARALRAAIDARLARYGADKKPKGDDPAAIGIEIENADYAVVERLRQSDEMMAADQAELEEMFAATGRKDVEERVQLVKRNREKLRKLIK